MLLAMESKRVLCCLQKSLAVGILITMKIERTHSFSGLVVVVVSFGGIRLAHTLEQSMKVIAFGLRFTLLFLSLQKVLDDHTAVRPLGFDSITTILGALVAV